VVIIPATALKVLCLPRAIGDGPLAKQPIAALVSEPWSAP
jgi:hypothetical protein